MIISASIRTDLPAFYSKWFLNRIREGYVLVRNPYNKDFVTRYDLNSNVVDGLFFCTKNPAPLIPHLNELADYRWLWHVTLTPYGKDVEPNVPDKHFVVEKFKELSVATNRHNVNFRKSSSILEDDFTLIKNLDAVQWRYDPIFITDKYSVEQHVKSFSVMAELLAGYTHTCIISFVDIYNKVAQNFPELKPVSNEEQIAITKAFVEIGNRYDISIKTCVENSVLSKFGADCSGCSTAQVFEKAFGLENSALTFVPPKKKFARSECEVCVVSGDIGAYSNCLHLCKYCYANYGKDVVLSNHKMHDSESPLIIGNLKTNDVIHQAKQISWIVPRNDKQINLFDE
ncbi:MAG: DUF1848 domain-containing protein [Fibrobacter sp.]|nr:DUF1848 domain-containing protein [Fibrobacter sp.]